MKRIYYLLPIAGLLSLPTQMLAQKQTGNETILVNDSITLNLPEVFVKAERPKPAESGTSKRKTAIRHSQPDEKQTGG